MSTPRDVQVKGRITGLNATSARKPVNAKNKVDTANQPEQVVAQSGVLEPALIGDLLAAPADLGASAASAGAAVTPAAEAAAAAEAGSAAAASSGAAASAGAESALVAEEAVAAGASSFSPGLTGALGGNAALMAGGLAVGGVGLSKAKSSSGGSGVAPASAPPVLTVKATDLDQDKLINRADNGLRLDLGPDYVLQKGDAIRVSVKSADGQWIKGQDMVIDVSDDSQFIQLKLNKSLLGETGESVFFTPGQQTLKLEFIQRQTVTANQELSYLVNDSPVDDFHGLSVSFEETQPKANNFRPVFPNHINMGKPLDSAAIRTQTNWVVDLGDIDGNGRSDFLYGYTYSSGTDTFKVGRSGVIGGNSAVDRNYTNTPILAETQNPYQSAVAIAAGDISGDGFTDVVTGMPDMKYIKVWDAASNQVKNQTTYGAVTVSFGRADANFVFADLAELHGRPPSAGFMITNKVGTYGGFGQSVSVIGDVNGDGLNDMLIGAPQIHSAGTPREGQSYLVFGSTGHLEKGAVDISELLASKRAIALVESHDLVPEVPMDGHWGLGTQVAGAGDLNGDGYKDFVLLNEADSADQTSVGKLAVLYGGPRLKATTGNIPVDNLSANGMGYTLTINAEQVGGPNDSNLPSNLIKAAATVADARDFNGDGYDDLAVAWAAADDAQRKMANSGEVTVVFGGKIILDQTTSALLTAKAGGVSGRQALRILGENGEDLAGYSVTSAGDFNGDGFDDLLIGAPGVDVLSGTANVPTHGRSYVVYGTTHTQDIQLSNVALGQGGFIIDERAVYPSAQYQLGKGVANLGDVNADGFDDLLVSRQAGGYAENFIVNGGHLEAITGHVNVMGGIGNDTLQGSRQSDVIYAGDGNDTIMANGGADVIRAGGGDDILVINASNVDMLSRPAGSDMTVLEGGVRQVHVATVDGGTGLNTLKLEGIHGLINFSSAALYHNIKNINIIDITGLGSENNTLKMSAKDVLAIGEANLFHLNGKLAITGTADEFGEQVDARQLMIKGDQGDFLKLTDLSQWTRSQIGVASGDLLTIDQDHYFVYNSADRHAQLLIDSDLVVIS